MRQKRLSSKVCRSGIEKIACGAHHFLILTDNNILLVGGNNMYGQCAQPIQTEPSKMAESLKIAQVRMDRHFVLDIAAGTYHSLLIAKHEGQNKLMAFGHELGCGFLDRKHRDKPTTIPSPEIPADDQVVRVFAGRMRSAVVLKTGKVKMWGEWYNGAKQRALRDVKVPVASGDRVDKIVMGQFHALFLSRQGTVYSWGDNTYGEIGFGVDFKWKTNPEAIPYFNGKVCVDVDAGGRHSLVLSDSGVLHSFGDNSEGQCGIELNRAYDPVVIETKGMLGDDRVQPIRIFAGDAHSALVTNEGDLFAWGDNSEERLGIHTTSSIFRPTLVEDVMGRNLCAVGLGGFFSIFVTGPKDHAIGSKDMSANYNNKIMKEIIFRNLKLGKDEEKPEEGPRQSKGLAQMLGFTKKKDEIKMDN